MQPAPLRWRERSCFIDDLFQRCHRYECNPVLVALQLTSSGAQINPMVRHDKLWRSLGTDLINRSGVIKNDATSTLKVRKGGLPPLFHLGLMYKMKRSAGASHPS